MTPGSLADHEELIRRLRSWELGEVDFEAHPFCAALARNQESRWLLLRAKAADCGLDDGPDLLSRIRRRAATYREIIG